MIAAKAKERQAKAGGDKKSDFAKSLSPKCEKAIEAIHTDKELERLSGISKNTIRRAKIIKERPPAVEHGLDIHILPQGGRECNEHQ